MTSEKDAVHVGLIGMGDMGRLYAGKLSAGGWRHIHICDVPQRYDALRAEFEDRPGVHVHENGHLVSRISDFVIYSVEAAYLDAAVQAYGPCAESAA